MHAMLKTHIAVLTLGITFAGFASAQINLGRGKPQQLFNQYCASCHGTNLNEGQGGSLVDGPWDYVDGSVESMQTYIHDGNLDQGMPPFGQALSDKEIFSLILYIREKRHEYQQGVRPPPTETDGVYTAGGYTFRLETVAEGFDTPWAIAFLPDGGQLVTERSGALRIVRDGKVSEPVSGTPEVWANGQGGLLEVALHPDYAENGWVYLGFSKVTGKSRGRDAGMTAIERGRIKDGRWVDAETIFEVTDEDLLIPSGAHFGTRFVFDDGYLFFGIGDRRRDMESQDLSRPNGKIHRIHDDGRIPADNPFVEDPEAFPSVWAYGVRNPQGLDQHPETGALWETEHGPRGGDEINRIERGKNYGWPVITYGMNYDGSPITDQTSKPGMEQPEHFWTPSIAVCGIDFYEGDVFPQWKNDLFIGGLAARVLQRARIKDGAVVEVETIVSDAGRVRDVASGPDGYLYLVLNGPNKIARLVPAK